MEEETVAMETDQFSKIPVHVIHCILSFLPSVKDVVRTSVISKSCHQAWRTFPIPQFNLQDFDYRRSSVSKQEEFIRFVSNTLQRFVRDNGEAMKIFNLSTINKMAHHHITRWMGMALDIKVEHLALDIFQDTSSLPCLIPDRVLSAYWLKSLKLVGHAICIQSLNENSHVDLPSLTSLCIQYSNCINDEQLQKLLSGCPALEDIVLFYCESLSKVDIFEHPNLQTLEYFVRESIRADRHVAIRVRAPKLKSFNYSFHRLAESDIIVKIHNSPELKSLRISDEIKTDEWFHKFIAQFPLLENLTIDCCYALRKIRISNPLLKKIEIKYCDLLKDVVISSKKLTSLSLLNVYSSIPSPSIQMEMDNPPNDCKANICNPANPWCVQLMEASWYCKLKEFLTRPFTFKSLRIHMIAIYAADGDMNSEDVHKKLPHAACNIEKLILHVKARPPSCHPHILNGLLSTCHPTTIELDVISNNIFGKSINREVPKLRHDEFVCEELGNRKNDTCLCKDDFECWKHQLKEVKVEKIKGMEVEKNLDWNTLFGILPTLKAGNIVCFRLMW